MSGRVIVVGSVNIDLVARVPHLPRPGETVTGGSYARHHGGKGGNQAVAAARLRRPTLFIGAVGDDPFASEARRALLNERVDVSMMASLAGQPTGMALILVEGTGENEIAVVPGANAEIESGYVRECLGRLGRLTGDVVLVCCEVPLNVVREALVCGHAAGATTILNPAPALGIDRSIFGLADIITPNRGEMLTLLQTEARRSGRRQDANAEIGGRARLLLEDGPEGPGVRKAVIVTVGAAGVVVLEREGSGLDRTPAAPAQAAAAEDAEPAAAVAPPVATTAPTPPAPPAPVSAGPVAVPASPHEPCEPTTEAPRGARIHEWESPAEKVATVDSTGAGDAFNGALAASIAEGRPFAEAVRRAIVAAGITTTQPGAREGMPTSAALDQYLAAR